MLTAVQDAERRRRQRAAVGVGVILLVATAVFLAWALIKAAWALAVFLVVMAGVTTGLILLARRGAVRAAGLAFGLVPTAGVLAGAVLHGHPGFASFYLIVGVALSALVLRARDVGVVFGAALAAELAIIWLVPVTPDVPPLGSAASEGTLLLIVVGTVCVAMANSIGALIVDVDRSIQQAEAANARAGALATQLEHSQRLQVLGRLTGVVAHDVNNLLAIIQSAAAMAGEQLPSGSPAHADIKDLDGAVLRAAALTRQLLAFSRREPEGPQIADVVSTISGAQELLRRLLGHDVHLHLHLPGMPCPVLASGSQLEQVVLNLAINARDAMGDKGDLFIDVERVETAAGGSICRLTVKDTGAGMSEAVRSRIFEPFFTTKGEGGTGLGLSTVSGIVTRLGGTLSVDSAPGQGATFSIELPIATVAVVASTPTAPTGSPPAASVAAAAEPVLQPLRLAGHQVRSFADTAALLSTDAHVDVVVVDAPGHSDDLVSQMQQRHPGLRVVLVSAETSPATKPTRSPTVSVLTRPFSPAALVEVVQGRLPSRANGTSTLV